MESKFFPGVYTCCCFMASGFENGFASGFRMALYKRACSTRSLCRLYLCHLTLMTSAQGSQLKNSTRKKNYDICVR